MLSPSLLHLCSYIVCVCLNPQETVRQLQQFSELTYRYAVAAMKEEVTFDEAPDHFRGERQSDAVQHLAPLYLV